MSLNQELQSVKQRFGIIGNAPALNHAIQIAIQVAPTDMTVLITGESGSGKESFSKIIHHLSTRKHGQFIAINCGGIPEGTIDSELFGHEKGSFTGAQDARKGYFEVTNGGTIFLDEIGDMPLGTQARLLRVLESGEFIRVGSSKVQKTDVRVVTATNVNLLEAVQKGRFREDLYYRLNTVPIYVPPLRERGTDIDLIFRKFASDFSEKYKMPPVRLNDEAKQLLIKYRFPGNIRQLRNIAERMSVLETERDVQVEQLRKYLPVESTLPALSGNGIKTDDFSERDILYKILFDMKKDMNDLKKLVFDSLQQETYGSQIINKHSDLFHSIGPIDETLPSKPSFVFHKNPRDEDEDIEVVEDIDHSTEDNSNESLSLDEKEKEMILKALKKNHNKRKYAAQDLGISERTLYRKLKLYQIDENESNG
ncbi:sigma-54 dependent transcriptional regulator [uncultured Cytophaga sp.]|uniref:sigma-54 interaction domain-containing protein n=1 Tax=uncultured Cytophaga sp. TaxID=160238 RepID=UPI00260BF7F1|nr:sigma-54 dependent transcriptional regulator [uncultured Cytophaga sp.]